MTPFSDEWTPSPEENAAGWNGWGCEAWEPPPDDGGDRAAAARAAIRRRAIELRSTRRKEMRRTQKQSSEKPAPTPNALAGASSFNMALK